MSCSSINRRMFVQLMAASGLTAAAAPSKLSLDQLTVAGCSLTNLGFEGTLRKILDMGFAGVEIATFPEKNGPEGQTYPFAVVDALSAEDKTRLRALVKQFRHVSTHLPYYPDFRPFAKDPALRERSRRELLRSVADSGFWGASVANVHVISEPNVPYRELKPDLVAFYRELADLARRSQVRLAIETTRPYAMKDYLDLVESVDRDNVGGTIDTGHMGFYKTDLGVADSARNTPEAVRRYNDLLVETVRNLGRKLIHFHIQDPRPSDWKDHYVPGTGIVDWPRLFREVAKTGYQGLFVAEILYYEGSQFEGLEQTRSLFRKTVSSL